MISNTSASWCTRPPTNTPTRSLRRCSRTPRGARRRGCGDAAGFLRDPTVTSTTMQSSCCMTFTSPCAGPSPGHDSRSPPALPAPAPRSAAAPTAAVAPTATAAPTTTVARRPAGVAAAGASVQIFAHRDGAGARQVPAAADVSQRVGEPLRVAPPALIRCSATAATAGKVR